MWKKWITLRSDAEPRAELQQVCLLTHSTLSWRLLHRSVRPGSQNGDIAAATWTQHTHKQTRQAAKKPSHSQRLPASSHMTSGVSTLQRSDLERELSINRKRFREGFDHVIITSAKDVMFSPTSVCWSVGLSDGWHKNYRMIPPHWWFRVPGPGSRVPGPGVRLGGFLPFLIIFQATTHQAWWQISGESGDLYLWVNKGTVESWRSYTLYWECVNIVYSAWMSNGCSGQLFCGLNTHNNNTDALRLVWSLLSVMCYEQIELLLVQLFCDVQVGSAVRMCGGSLSPSFWSGCLMPFWMWNIAGRHKTHQQRVCCMYNASEEYYHFSSETANIQPVNSHHDCDNLILQPEW